jgi:uncharacterized protein (TIGR03435 family)
MMDERYDVGANVPPGTTKDGFRSMLQRLLHERLGLVARRETKLMQGYRLAVAKDGPKLTRAAGAPGPASNDAGWYYSSRPVQKRGVACQLAIPKAQGSYR